MTNSYWSRVLNGRANRRRVLAAAGAASLGSAFLAACGGKESSVGTSGLLTKPVDSTKAARRGGTFHSYKNLDAANLDPAVTHTTALTPLNRGYGKLFYVKPGYLQPSTFEVAGDVCDSWEWSPDGLTLTAKLRQGVGFAPLPPVNGRNLDVGDIAYAFKRYAEIGSNRSDYFNSLNPDAPITSVTTPDTRTVVIKMASPTVGIIARLGGSYRRYGSSRRRAIASSIFATK